DAEFVANPVEVALGALAYRPELRIRVTLVNGDELGPEAEAYDGDLDLVRHVSRLVARVENEGAFLVRDDDIGIPVSGQVVDGERDTYAAIIVDQVGNVVNTAFLRAHQPEPVQHGRRVRLRIAERPVCPVALAGHDIHGANQTHIHEGDGVRLREAHTVWIVAHVLAHDQMPLEGSVGSLLEPCETPPVCVEARDDVVAAVDVDVVGVHLRAARPEIGWMVPPESALGAGSGVLPPAPGHQDVGVAVPVDVADAETVREMAETQVVRDRMKGPRLGRPGRIARREAETALVVKDEIGPPVTGDVTDVRRLLVHAIEGEVPRPVAVATLRIFVPERLLARKSDDQDVVPPVGIEVKDLDEEVVGVPARIERPLRIELVPGLVVGTLVPERSGHDVRRAVAVQIADSGPFGVEDVRKLDALESRRHEAESGEDDEQDGVPHGLSPSLTICSIPSRITRCCSGSST